MKVLAYSLLLVAAIIIVNTHVYAQQQDDPLFPVNDGDRTLYINRTCTFVIPPTHLEVQNFSEGRASVLVNREKYAWATIDRTGKIVIPARPDAVTHFSNGLSRIKIDSEEGFIDRNGKTVIEPNFFHADDFRDGLAFANGGGDRPQVVYRYYRESRLQISRTQSPSS